MGTIKISFSCVLLILLLIVISPLTSFSSPLVIERYNGDNLDLERYWVLGYLDQPIPARYPFGTREVVTRLQVMDDNGALDDYSAYLLHIYRLEWDLSYVPESTSKTFRFFHPLFKRLGDMNGSLFSKNLDFYQVRDEENELDFGINTLQRFEIVQDDLFREESFTIHGWGLETWLTWKGRFGAFVRFTDTVESGGGTHTNPYSEYAGYIARSDDGSSLSFDETIAYMAYQGELFRFRAGRGKHAWGPGLFQRLVFADQYLAYPYVEMEFNWRDKMLFTFFHGQIDASGEVPDDTVYVSVEGNSRMVGREKYVAAHRLELMPKSWLAFGFTEAVIYGERDPELGYMIPVNIFWSEGHNQDYDDNVMWSADMRVRLMKGLLVYGEFFIDEMNFGALFSDEFGNRTGFVAGSRWLAPLGLDRVDLRVEYTRLRPFVYTHWYDINLPSHYGEMLGSQLEPNSDELYGRIRWNPYDDLTLDLFGIKRRHGATPEGEEPVGGSYLESRYKNDGIYPFLAGERQDRDEVGVTVTWRALEQLQIFVSAASGSYINQDYTRVIGGMHYRY